MRYLNGGMLISPKDILEAKIRIKLPGEKSYYETEFKDFFEKRSTEILEAHLGEQLFAHLKRYHSLMTKLANDYDIDGDNVVDFFFSDTMMNVPSIPGLLPPLDEEE